MTAVLLAQRPDVTEVQRSAAMTARSRRFQVGDAERPAPSSQSSCSATVLGWSYSRLSGVIASSGESGTTTSASTKRPPGRRLSQALRRRQG